MDVNWVGVSMGANDELAPGPILKYEIKERQLYTRNIILTQLRRSE
jgi:hypothetical protein